MQPVLGGLPEKKLELMGVFEPIGGSTQVGRVSVF